LELLEPGALTLEAADEVIMAARAHWFADEESAPADAEGGQEEDAAGAPPAGDEGEIPAEKA